MRVGREGDKEAPEHGGDTQPGRCPIAERVVCRAKRDGLAGNEADDDVRSCGMIRGRGQDDGGSALHAGDAGEVHYNETMRSPASNKLFVLRIGGRCVL